MRNALPAANTEAEAIERRAVLIAALESGNYKQGKHALRTLGMVVKHYEEQEGRWVDPAPTGEQFFCCQGVAVDVFAPEAWVPPNPTDYNMRFGALLPGSDTQVISGYWPKDVRRYLGISRDDADTLAGINDDSTDFGPSIDALREMPVTLYD